MVNRRLVAAALIASQLLPGRAIAGDVKDWGLAAAGLGLFAVFASQARSKDFVVVSRGTDASPDFGTEQERTPGSPIFAVFKYQEMSAVRVVEGNSKGQLLFKTTGPKPAFCFADLSSCFLDKNGDGTLDFDVGTNRGANLPIKPERIKVDLPSDGFRYELLYQGFAGGVLRLTYREYVDDMVRPAFTQELTYEVSSLPTRIAFRDVVFEISQLGNLSMRYSVIGDPASWSDVAPPGAES